jgi:hypothetical protein
MLRNVCRVISDTADERGAQAMLESQAHEVEPGDVRRHASPVSWMAVLTKRRKIDPAVVRLEPRAPHDDPRLDHDAAADWEPTLCLDEFPNAGHAGIGQRLLRDPDTRIAPAPCSFAHAATNHRVGGCARHGGPQPAEEVAAEKSAWEIAGIATGKPDLSNACELECDLCTGIAGADYQRRPVR